MRNTVNSVLIGALALGFLLITSDRSAAYSAYTNSTCASASCHPGFQSKGALHDIHQPAFTNNCNLCHPSGPGSKPVSTFSAGDATAFSCLGCHGRDYGGSIGRQSAGLRAKHAAAGITSCGGCHPSDPTPLFEDVLPPHYGRGDVTLTSSCMDNLDNDGNGFVDSADPNCPIPVEKTTWGKIKSLYQ